LKYLSKKDEILVIEEVGEEVRRNIRLGLITLFELADGYITRLSVFRATQLPDNTTQ
jgi:hypothetical protein